MVHLAECPQIQTKVCYTALTFGLKHSGTYFLGSPPDIQDLLELLENAKSPILIHIFAFQRPNTVKLLNFGILNEGIFKPNEACYVKTLKYFCCAQEYIRTDTTGKH